MTNAQNYNEHLASSKSRGGVFSNKFKSVQKAGGGVLGYVSLGRDVLAAYKRTAKYQGLLNHIRSGNRDAINDVVNRIVNNGHQRNSSQKEYDQLGCDAVLGIK